MVNFSVFNESSLPMQNEYEVVDKFKTFFKILEKLSEKDFDKIRMDKNFKDYQILDGVNLYTFYNRLTDQNFKDRLQYFLANKIIKIESPLIKDEEINDDDENIISEYYLNDKKIYNGLVFAYIWDTISISFDSSKVWDTPLITLKKNTDEDISIKHTSKISHLINHSLFFEEFERYKQENITVKNFFELREELFTKVVICDEVEKQITKLEVKVFNKALAVLRNLDKGTRKLSDYTISGEGETVKTNPKLKAARTFKVEGNNEFFEKHMKGFFNGYRMHYFERGDKIYIGYIGSHLSTKSDK